MAVRHQDDAALAVLVKEPLGNPAEALEIAVPHGIRQRQHLQRSRHALHLGVEHEANAANRFKDPLRRVLPVLLVVMVDDAGSENNQRQRGSRDQKDETHWQ